jgi:hypothetical protein
MAALRGGHPGQHDDTFRVTLDGRVKPGHDNVEGVVRVLFVQAVACGRLRVRRRVMRIFSFSSSM